MKKANIVVPALAMVIGISTALSGCTKKASAAQVLSGSTSTTTTSINQADNISENFSASYASSSEAYESNEIISSKDISVSEENRRNEIMEQYSIYKPYGMVYDKEKDRFFYNGKLVRFFKDQVSEYNTNSFFFDDGVIDVEPVRNADGTLAGLKQSSDSDFKARTKKEKEIRSNFEGITDIDKNASFEGGNPDYQDDSLEVYTGLGVSYDKVTDNWIYNDKAIHILYDADHNAYCDNGIKDGINLKVIRDNNGNIEKLIEVTQSELEKYIK